MSLTARIVQISSNITLNIWRGFNTMATNPKNPRVSTKIGTHNGVFHCDEALAYFMLKQLPEYEEAEIIRTRDQKILDECDVVIDVGGEYNPKKHRYDHHQKSFNETISTVRPDLFKNKTIKLSSAGLIYAHFGIEVLTQMLKKVNIDASDTCLTSIYQYIYDGFMEEIDAIDNGVPLIDGKPNYRINTHLSARVHRFNPKWNSINSIPDDEAFIKAVKLVGDEFTEKVLESVNVWWPARDIVKKSVDNRKNVYKTGEIIQLEESCPWKDHLFAIEDEMGISGLVKFVLFPDSNGSWRVQSVPIQPDSFICRIFLHENWRGLRDDELSEISGIPECVFCHHTGFIGGNKSENGAFKMALKSLNSESH